MEAGNDAAFLLCLYSFLLLGLAELSYHMHKRIQLKLIDCNLEIMGPAPILVLLLAGSISSSIADLLNTSLSSCHDSIIPIGKVSTCECFLCEGDGSFFKKINK